MYFVRACRKNEVEFMRSYLEKTTEIPEDIARQAIQVAAENGNFEAIELILQDGRIDPSVNDNIAIQAASANGHIGVVSLLLDDKRVDPSAMVNYAIRMASQNGHDDVVKLLLNDDRVDPTAMSNISLISATKNGHQKVVELLSAHPKVKNAQSVSQLQQRLSDEYTSADSDNGYNSDSDSDDGEATYFMDPTVNKFPKKQKVSYPKMFPGEDLDDAQAVNEYVDEIYANAMVQEKEEFNESKIAANDLTAPMYSILIDWMVDVCVAFKLMSETFELASYYIKFCIQDKEFAGLKRDKLQLLGVACLMIAAKTEEMYTPTSKDYVRVADFSFKKKDLLTMEQRVLKTLQFHVNFITPLLFLRLYSRIQRSEVKTHTLSKYLTEYSMVDFNLISQFLPSEIAAGSVYLACLSLDIGFNTSRFLEFGLTESRIKETARSIQTLVAYTKYKAVNKKYSKSTLLEVGTIPLKEVK